MKRRSKYELWQLAGAVADQLERTVKPFVALPQTNLAGAIAQIKHLAATLRESRGPNPAERVPPICHSEGGRRSAANKAKGQKR